MIWREKEREREIITSKLSTSTNQYHLPQSKCLIAFSITILYLICIIVEQQ